MRWCNQLYNDKERFVIEEKLCGEEFSLFTFCDGKNFVHCPIVKDYKRSSEGDKGINTGGMGSVSMQDGKMPFLSWAEVDEAQTVNERVVKSLMLENNNIP